MHDGAGSELIDPTISAFFEGHEEPLRAEMHGIRHLEQSAGELGRTHRLLFYKKGDPLFFRRFEENVRIIRTTYRNLNELARQGKTLAPSEEWLIDNYYLVSEQMREIREDLPKEFYYQLPKLADSPGENVPRVFDLAEQLIANTDSYLNGETVKQYVTAYQKTGKALTIGEIWALPVALRLVLIENLRRICVLSESTRREQQKAKDFADRILESAPEETGAQAVLAKQILNADGLANAPWLVQVIRRLRNKDERVTQILEAIEKKLRVNDYAIEQIFVLEQRAAAAAVVTIGNIITSFRWVKAFDWSVFFEEVNRVDEILREDPAGIYARMEFETRDRYRQKIERIARRGKKSEIEIAHRVVELARAAEREADDPGGRIRAHIGYYLLSDPAEQLEREFGYQLKFAESFRRRLRTQPDAFYLGTIAVISVFFIILAAVIVRHYDGGWFAVLLTMLLALIPGMTLAVSVLNWDLTKIFPATVLPKMDFSKGIPDDESAIVVIPTMFGSVEAVHEMFGRLEVHYLANQDEELYFAILSDFADADGEEKPEDAAIMEAAAAELEKLNRRYTHLGDDGTDPRFHLFHRRRVWSETEGKWIGRERKRGKIEEFNRYLRGAEDTTFTTATLAPEKCAAVKYVITLDSDTKLPPGTARKLVGIIAHPLNRPHFAVRTNRIDRGYAILQPRVSITAESTSKSVFAQIMAGFAGLDPYTTAASDVYQDLYDAGIYTGKGLYVVDAFEKALADRIPAESLLSHDLFESIFARTALVSDIEFFDDYPAVYEAHAKRLHRWVRGDWQLLPWLAPFVPRAGGGKQPNDLPLAARWKILDNLRRSLIAPAIFLLFAAAWIVLPAPPIFLTLLTVFVLAFPVYAHVSNGLLEHPRGVNWENRLESFSGELILNTLQFFTTLVFLPHQAVLMVDAIVRTIYRLFFTRRHLLEWQTAAQIEEASSRELAASWRFMRSATFLSLAVLAGVLFFRPGSLLVALPFLILWLISPFFAFYVTSLKRANQKRSTPTHGRPADMAFFPTLYQRGGPFSAAG